MSRGDSEPSRRVEPEMWGVALSHSIHLNPVRVARLGVEKGARTRQWFSEGLRDVEGTPRTGMRTKQWSSM